MDGELTTSAQGASTIPTGSDLKTEGIASAAASNIEFLRRMREEAHRIAQRTGRVSINDLRTYAALHGLTPKHPNAWGAVFKVKGWRKLGHATANLPSSHAREVGEWTYDGN